jgi:hypothetical protein
MVVGGGLCGCGESLVVVLDLVLEKMVHGSWHSLNAEVGESESTSLQHYGR